MKRLLFLALSISGIVLMSCGGSPAPTPTTSSPVVPTIAQSQPTTAPAPTQAPAQPTTAPESTPAPQPTTASNIEPPSGDPFAILKNATLAELQAKSFRATTTIESGDGKTTELVIEYVSPDRIHVISSSGEQIAIKGKGSWSKKGDKWEAAPAGMENILFQALTPEALDEQLKMIQANTVKFVGADLLDSKPMFVYQYDTVVDIGNNQSIKGTSKIWIGALERRAYRVESVSDSLSKPGTQDKITAVYIYDLPITIEPPL